MTMILPTINVVARPCGLPPNWFVASNFNNGTTFCVNPVNGIIVDPVGCARENYDITTGDFLGFLIESNSTNWIGNPGHRQLITPYWSATGTATASAGIRDDSTTYNTCTLFTPGSGTASASKSLTTSNSSKYTLSAYVKVQTSTNTATVKLSNGSSVKTVSVTGPNWVRIYIGTTATSTSTTIKVEVTGAATYVDFVQFELGNLTSAIAGTSAIPTRNYDKITNVSGDPFASLINPNTGTFLISYLLNDNDLRIKNSWYSLFELINIASTGIQVAHITDDATSTSDAIIVRTLYSNVWHDSITLVPASSTQIANKIAISYIASGVMKLCINGGIVTTLAITTSPLPTTPLNLGYMANVWPVSATTPKTFQLFGSVGANVALDGHLKHFAYFPSALSDTDLQAITTI